MFPTGDLIRKQALRRFRAQSDGTVPHRLGQIASDRFIYSLAGLRPRVLLPEQCMAVIAKSLAFLRRIDQFENSVRKLMRITGFNRKAILVFMDEFGDGAYSCSNNRNPVRHRFEEYNSERLQCGWKTEDRGLLEIVLCR